MRNGEGAVALVDDEADVRAALSQMFELEQIMTLAFGDAESALAKIDERFAGVVVTDLRMPGMDGYGLFNRLRQIDPELPVIILSGHGDLVSAVDLVKRGAYDFLSKPCDGDVLIAAVRRALEKRSLVLENRSLRQQAVTPALDALIGDSLQIEHVRQTLLQLAQADVDVLISGESGTGKSLAAAMLHRRSRRGRRAMIAIDCSALPADHAESFLFGHVSGAVPGAQFPRTGQLVRADGGTLFLDHVDRLSPPLQARLLNALEQGAILPVGSSQTTASSFRTISASSTQLQQQVDSGRFERSLFFRLGSFHLCIPPLRERRSDIVPLFRHFLADAAAGLKREPPLLSSAVWRKLHDHDWPGNVREIRSFAMSVALGLGDEATGLTAAPDTAGPGLREATARFEAEMIRRTLMQTQGDISATITALALPRKTLYDKLARHGINPADYRQHRRLSGMTASQ